MPTMDEYLTRPVDVRLARLRSTPEELASLLAGRDRPALTRRPDPGSWSAAEIVCHLRDVEKLFLVRFLTAEQWQRRGIHQARGRMRLDEWVASFAGHDDNHLEQLRRTIQ